METKTSLHPIHPTLQFEAKHALRFLDNLLKNRTTAVSGGRDLFGAVGVFASGRDLKADFEPLRETIGPYEFRWNGDSLECTTESSRNAVRHGTFEVDFGDEPCTFLDDLWSCPQPEVRACVRAAVSRLAKAVAGLAPAMDGRVAARCAVLARRYRLSRREMDVFLVGLCETHDLLEYDLDGRCCGASNLVRLEEAAAYLGCGVDDVLPLVRNDAKLVACGLMDDDLTPTRNALEFLEGHVAIPGIKARGLGAENSHGSDDDLFDGLDLFAGGSYEDTLK